MLRVFALLIAVGSLLMIFGGKPLVLRVFPRPPEVEVSTLLLFVLKELGGVMLMLAVLLWLAARDPLRNVAVVYALIVGFCILSMTPLLSFWTLPVREIYPGHLVWGRSLVRLAIAALFLLFAAARALFGSGEGLNRTFLKGKGARSTLLWA